VTIKDVTEPIIEQCLAKAARIAAAKNGKPWREANKTQVY
jgi:hypothetical protein